MLPLPPTSKQESLKRGDLSCNVGCSTALQEGAVASSFTAGQAVACWKPRPGIMIDNALDSAVY